MEAVVGVLVGLSVGIVVGWWWTQRTVAGYMRREAEKERALADKNAALYDMGQTVARQEEVIRHLKVKNADKEAELLATDTRLKHEFEVMSHAVLRSHAEQFKKDGLAGMRTVLEPFKEDIHRFREKVEYTQTIVRTVFSID